MLESIFIIGCARSGTTILGEFFENNSICKYFHEIDVWDKNSIITDKNYFHQSLIKFKKSIRGGLPRNNELMKLARLILFKTNNFFQTIHLMKIDKGHRLTEDDVTDEIIEQVKIFNRSLEGKHLVVKNPRNSLRIGFIKKIFPTAKFVHIVRDGRDVTCSLMGNHYHGYWAHMKPPRWKEWQKKHPKGPTKYAWQWNATIDIINSDKKKIPKNDFIEIRYEDLIQNPEKTIRFVFESLKIPIEETQLNLCKQVSNKMDGTYQTSDRWTVFNHSKRIGRFKENLTPEELKKVESIIGKNNLSYNYE